MVGNSITISDPANEEAISTALVNWYRRLLERGQEKAARSVQVKLDELESVLPTAVLILREALAEAE